jgi:hypothetical protein
MLKNTSEEGLIWDTRTMKTELPTGPGGFSKEICGSSNPWVYSFTFHLADWTWWVWRAGVKV